MRRAISPPYFRRSRHCLAGGDTDSRAEPASQLAVARSRPRAAEGDDVEDRRRKARRGGPRARRQARPPTPRPRAGAFPKSATRRVTAPRGSSAPHQRREPATRSEAEGRAAADRWPGSVAGSAPEPGLARGSIAPSGRPTTRRCSPVRSATAVAASAYTSAARSVSPRPPARAPRSRRCRPAVIVPRAGGQRRSRRGRPGRRDVRIRLAGFTSPCTTGGSCHAGAQSLGGLLEVADRERGSSPGRPSSSSTARNPCRRSSPSR